MQRFQVKCNTVLVVEGKDAAEAIVAFIAALNKGGFHYTTTSIKEFETDDDE